MEQARQALKKLNVFTQLPNKHTGNAMFSKARLDTPSDGIFGITMTLLILDMRPLDDFHPTDAAELVQGLFDLWPKFLPCVLSFGVLGLRWRSNVEVAAGPNTSAANTSIGGCLIPCGSPVCRSRPRAPLPR
jgi:hypothetical protein